MVGNKLRSTGLVGLFLFGAGCEPLDSSDPVERTGEAADAISNPCNPATYNAPCDPDGNGVLTECEGVCAPNGQGTIVCLPVSTLGVPSATLDGRLCGTGVANDCSKNGRVCASGACVDTNGSNVAVPDGTACQASSQQIYCSGSCQGGQCTPLANPCSYGQQPGCVFETCNPTQATQCIDDPILGCSSTSSSSASTGAGGGSSSSSSSSTGAGGGSSSSSSTGAGGGSSSSSSSASTGAGGGSSTSTSTTTTGSGGGSSSSGSTSSTGNGGSGGMGGATSTGTTGVGGESSTSSTGSMSTGNTSGSGGSGAGGDATGAGGSASSSSGGNVFPQGGGCSCRTAETRPTSDAGWVALAMAAVLGRRRRQRRAT